MGRFEELSFEAIRTQSVRDRMNLVRIGNLANLDAPVEPYGDEAMDELADRIAAARRNGRPVIWFQGAHVIKCGLSRFLVDLVRRDVVTHIAGNGACSIHDFELAAFGGTSEDVPMAIEDGSFGMWEETGAWMNEALVRGAADGTGYGEALARFAERHPDRFPYADDCLFLQAFRKGIPCTYHIALGTDIIHQHPSVDFAAIGATSGRDFRIFCHSVSQLDGGVFLNFGSGVIGPEVFLKALSIARNLGYPTFRITTANFDLVTLEKRRLPGGKDPVLHYYRPRKNVVLRPTSQGGWGHHFCGDHRVTIPTLHRKVVARLG